MNALDQLYKDYAELRARVKELDKSLQRLRVDNLRMRLHLEVILDGGEAAERVLDIYRKERDKRREQELENLN